MDKTVHEKHADTTFNEESCKLYAEIIQQDILNVKVLFYIAKCEQTNVQATVKTIAANVTSTRRVGVRDNSNTLVRFANEKGLIDRKTAERVVDRLAYASLIYYEVQRPFKFIKLTNRGIQVVIYIKQNMEVNNNG